MRFSRFAIFSFLFVLLQSAVFGQVRSPLESLSIAPNYESHRISSYDRNGYNADWISIEPGETRVLAEIDGPGAITHFWNTISAEPYYSRMLIMRFYWDGQAMPSVEVPLGDFFGVGHGLNIPFHSFVMDNSSEGRARNCYWYMPFKKSAKVTVTHEGFNKVRSFYYYIDYRSFKTIPDDSLYFHAQYRQAVPNPAVDIKGKNIDGKTNYLLMETTGRGQYVGTIQSVQINQDGWYGEGDDMFFVDGAETPTMTGTGTEDYFNDAWGFRPFDYLYHGVTLWEGYKKGNRGTAYKWHIFDPVAFTKSLRATIEHGHANDRQDDFYTVAFWYQTLPSPEPPAMPNVMNRLPDEGQLYAERTLIGKEITTHLQEKRLDAALARVQEVIDTAERADEYGYWSLRKGFLLKQTGKLAEAKKAFDAALEKSQKEDKYSEWDAGSIHWTAERECPVLADKKKARLYAFGDDTYEIFLDGKSIGQGGGGDQIGDFEIALSRGKHTLAVKAVNRSGAAGLAIQLSHIRGYELTDETWKVSETEAPKWNEKKFNASAWKNAAPSGTLGEAPWNSMRQPFAFLAPILTAKAIWTPDGAKDNQTVYFRKEFQVK
ncbi:MAG: DUF2961 domain-containing protein [Candidatus Omnitrophota bacterium]